MAKKEKLKQNKIIIDHVENARLIKELQSEDWKVVRGMETFLVAFFRASRASQAMSLQQFADKYLKGNQDFEYYINLHNRRQTFRDAIVNEKDIKRLELKVEQLKSEKKKIGAQIDYFDKAKELELPRPFEQKSYNEKVERMSQIKKELTKFE